jgi:hypothetical protein
MIRQPIKVRYPQQVKPHLHPKRIQQKNRDNMNKKEKSNPVFMMVSASPISPPPKKKEKNKKDATKTSKKK